MSTRSLATLAVGLLLLAAGCSGGTTPASGTGESSPDLPSMPGEAPPRFTKFADFPGGELLFTQPGAPLGVRLKPIDTSWTGELATKPAAAGKHFLAVYVAVTGELPDRGVDNVELRGLTVRYKPTAGECKSTSYGDGYCYAEAAIASGLDEVADGTWHEYPWSDQPYVGTKLARGATIIGVAGFPVPDTIEAAGGFDLCAPSKKEGYSPSRFPGTPVKTPEQPRS
ncbi:hypothetical protein [Amycolatopsis sp. H20-H5]|uniref:hypothetical protein n=1 Tax=Amycolatopsis sp. H20-H5 TaxID=3046309 RepID=UPI002DB9CBB2|nr:hypothetical protein [Amycolatopsis sp. H20-H5]MEC3973866.1 hypothetical protein [Amycolatopsis sp. H20-H5]